MTLLPDQWRNSDLRETKQVIYIEDNKYYLNNIMEKVISKSKTKLLQNFF